MVLYATLRLRLFPHLRWGFAFQFNQVAIHPCTEKDPNAVKFSEEEAKQTYAIVVKLPALLVEFRRLLDFQEEVYYTIKGMNYPEENVSEKNADRRKNFRFLIFDLFLMTNETVCLCTAI